MDSNNRIEDIIDISLNSTEFNSSTETSVNVTIPQIVDTKFEKTSINVTQTTKVPTVSLDRLDSSPIVTNRSLSSNYSAQMVTKPNLKTATMAKSKETTSNTPFTVPASTTDGSLLSISSIKSTDEVISLISESTSVVSNTKSLTINAIKTLEPTKSITQTLSTSTRAPATEKSMTSTLSTSTNVPQTEKSITSTLSTSTKAPETDKSITSTLSTPTKASKTDKSIASTFSTLKKAPETEKSISQTFSTSKKAQVTEKSSSTASKATSTSSENLISTSIVSTTKFQKLTQSTRQSLPITKKTSTEGKTEKLSSRIQSTTKLIKSRQGFRDSRETSSTFYQMKTTPTSVSIITPKFIPPQNDIFGPQNTTITSIDASFGATALVLVVVLPFLVLFLIAIIIVLKKKCKKKVSKRNRNRKNDLELDAKDGSIREPLTKSNNDA